ncbi:tetratricopeptide repeat protein [Chloroflexi bacterium TSY]|nr:tetratricopeptide repeat protein [Chloroflexi bacterium TSY]
MSTIARKQKRFAEAEALCQQGLKLSQQLGAQLAIANHLHTLGQIARERGSYSEASQRNKESLTIYQENGERRGVAFCLNELGYAAWLLEMYETSRQYYQEALTTAIEIGAIPVALNALVGATAHLTIRGEQERELAVRPIQK